MRIITILHRHQDRVAVHIRNYDLAEVRRVLQALQNSLAGATPEEILLLDRMVRPNPEIDGPASCQVERLLLDTESVPGRLRLLGVPVPGIVCPLVLVLQFLKEAEAGQQGPAHGIIHDRSRRRYSFTFFRDDARRYVSAAFQIDGSAMHECGV